MTNKTKPTWGGARKGSGRKLTTEQKDNISVYITKRNIKKLAGMAEEQDKTRSEVVDKLIEKAK